jgi:uncharacterized membrane protein YdjX (TVP38/TMEM64 family)
MINFPSDRPTQNGRRPAKETASPSPLPGIRQPPKRRAWFAVAAAIVAGVILTGSIGVDWRALPQRITELNGAMVFALMSLLPVGGFSVGIIYLVAGAKFGPATGGMAVAGATAIHLLLTHWIAHGLLREPLLRLLARRGHRLQVVPAGENAAIAVMAALVPGIPYFARNYLLALSGVPLRIYFWICLPIYVARSYVTLFLGDLSGAPNRNGFLVLAAVYVVKLSVCAWLVARLRRRYQWYQESRTADPAPQSRVGPIP